MTYRFLRLVASLAACAWLASCATPPTIVVITPEEEMAPEQVSVPSPLVEYPPIEPVEPPIEAAPAATAPTPTPAPAEPAPVPAPVATAPTPAPQEPVASAPSFSAAPASIPPPPAPASRTVISVEDLELLALLSDLQRYGNLGPDDARREVNTATNQLARQRTDANRVRLAVLYTVSRANPQDDQRAVMLLENVVKGNGGNPGIKELAVVLQVQIMGRQRAVRDEQQKADAALQKLEALRQMERSLIRDRARSGGGGGGGSGGGG